MRLIHGASPLLTVALLLGTAGQAGADPAPAPDGLGALIAAVAEANQRLDELGAQVQTQQESVNKSLVEVQTARDNAATAQTELAASQQSVRDCDGAIADAQSRFDDYAVQTYMNGPSDALLTASNPDEVIQAYETVRTAVAGGAAMLDELCTSVAEHAEAVASFLASRKG